MAAVLALGVRAPAARYDIGSLSDWSAQGPGAGEFPLASNANRSTSDREIRMSTVQLLSMRVNADLCARFTWCASREPGHTVHQSPPVPLYGAEDRLLFAETCPDTGHLLYGPVLGGGDADESAGHARVLAAQLRVAAARLDELAVVAERGVGLAG